jgi:putative endonuclease
MFYVYIMSNKAHRLYTGFTPKLERRTYEHKNQLFEGFTSQYRFDRLVYFEIYATETRARYRERQIKGWTRAKKIALIESVNPWWHDLSAEWDDMFPLPIQRRPKP